MPLHGVNNILAHAISSDKNQHEKQSRSIPRIFTMGQNHARRAECRRSARSKGQVESQEEESGRIMRNFTDKQRINFYRKVSQPDLNGCHNWDGSKRSDGYGQFWINPYVEKAHRVALEMTGSFVPIGMMVLHSCVGNPSCVNPAHLRIGNQKENMHDRKAQGRHISNLHPERLARGERHGSKTHPEKILRGDAHASTKISEAKVAELRAIRYIGISQRKAALIFGISQSHVGRIWNGIDRKPIDTLHAHV